MDVLEHALSEDTRPTLPVRDSSFHHFLRVDDAVEIRVVCRNVGPIDLLVQAVALHALVAQGGALPQPGIALLGHVGLKSMCQRRAGGDPSQLLESARGENGKEQLLRLA